MDVRPRRSAQTFAGWANYVAVVARRLASNFPGAELGADIVVRERSAARGRPQQLVCARRRRRHGARATRRVSTDRPEWRAALPTTLDLAGYLGAVENGLTFGALTGTRGVGTHGGSEDHTAILTCQAEPRQRVLVRARPTARPTRRCRTTGASSSWRAAWRRTRQAAHARRYNRASLATRALRGRLARSEGRRGAHTRRNRWAAVLRRLREFAERLASVTGTEFAGARSLRRLAHFIAENDRVLRAAEAFRRADARALGELSAASQSDAETLLGNQIPRDAHAGGARARDGRVCREQFRRGFWRQRLGPRRARPMRPRLPTDGARAIWRLCDPFQTCPGSWRGPSPATLELDLTGS